MFQHASTHNTVFRSIIGSYSSRTIFVFLLVPSTVYASLCSLSPSVTLWRSRGHRRTNTPPSPPTLPSAVYALLTKNQAALCSRHHHVGKKKRGYYCTPLWRRAPRYETVVLERGSIVSRFSVDRFRLGICPGIILLGTPGQCYIPYC